MRNRLFCCAVFFGCAISRAQAVSPAVSDAKADTGPLVPAEVLRGLASESYKEREAAQRRLAEVPMAKRDALAQLAAGATDPEVRSRLKMRLNEMDDELAINPPLISLD